MPQRDVERAGSATEVLLAFLRLGCLSFGGPIAHLGYFHAELVKRRAWCGEAEFAEMVALAQTLPGPSSSQVALTLGLRRAGLGGSMAAWAGFTLPSALLMVAFAFFHQASPLGKMGTELLHGLQIVAVAIVAQAAIAMRRTLAPDPQRIGIAAAGLLIAFVAPASVSGLTAIVVGGALGSLVLSGLTVRREPASGVWLSRRAGRIAGSVFLGLLLASAVPVPWPGLTVFQGFYRTGALVFGGGHVVLPLLQGAVVGRGWVDEPTFLSGYGAAQALPGPLFTFAAFLGAAIPSAHPILLAGTALFGIFLPGLLLMIAVLPFWEDLCLRPRFQRTMAAGVNAGVLGVLVAALVRPVTTTAIHTVADAFTAAAALLALMWFKLPHGSWF